MSFIFPRKSFNLTNWNSPFNLSYLSENLTWLKLPIRKVKYRWIRNTFSSKLATYFLILSSFESSQRGKAKEAKESAENGLRLFFLLPVQWKNFNCARNRWWIFRGQQLIGTRENQLSLAIRCSSVENILWKRCEKIFKLSNYT